MPIMCCPSDPRLSPVPTVRFSGVAGAQLRPDVREYVAVHGCVRALTAAVVAVMVAVRGTSGPPASAAGSRTRAADLSAVDLRRADRHGRRQRPTAPVTAG